MLWHKNKNKKTKRKLSCFRMASRVITKRFNWTRELKWTFRTSKVGPCAITLQGQRSSPSVLFMTTMACALRQRIVLFVFLPFNVATQCKARIEWSAQSSRREVSLIPCVHFGREPVGGPSHLSWLYRCRSCGCGWPGGPRCCRGSPRSPKRSRTRWIGQGWIGPCRRWLPVAAGMRQGEF